MNSGIGGSQPSIGGTWGAMGSGRELEGREPAVTETPRALPWPRGLRYSRVAIALHWLIALFIIFNLSIGFFMEEWPAPYRMFAVGLHISAGLSVLALTVLRIGWRLLHEPPPYPAEMHRWERHAAHVAHFLLYAAMVLMPLTGWAIVSAHPRPGSPGFAVWAAQHPKLVPPPAPATTGEPPKPAGLKIWWLIDMPSITPIQNIGEEPGGVAAQSELHEEFITWHALGGYVLIGLVLLHVAGALKHQLIDKQAELARMGVGGRRRPDRHGEQTASRS